MIFDEQNKRNIIEVALAMSVILLIFGFLATIYILITKQWISL